MANAKDLVGQRYGKLTVIRFAGYTSDKSRMYLCKCDCGNEKVIRAKSLTSGGTASCGCGMGGHTKNNIIGQRFGKLTVQSYVKHGFWKCKCDCGNIKNANYSDLVAGKIQSCGCLKKNTGERQVKNISGQKFGRLSVLGRAETPPHKHGAYWKCQCECGKVVTVYGAYLRAGSILSCGCLQRKMASESNMIHGFANTRLYRIYHGMLDRCTRTKNTSYKSYGGRGIKVCNEWLHDFIAFHDWAMANGYDETLSIDRIDVNGDYEPSNCRWVGGEIQQNNTTRNVHIELNGEILTMKQVSTRIGVSYEVLRYYYREKKWSIEKIIEFYGKAK